MCTMHLEFLSTVSVSSLLSLVGTLVNSSEKIGKKNTMKELVCGCDLKMSHIEGSPQLVSVYIWEK
jgi:hypothetical protein